MPCCSEERPTFLSNGGQLVCPRRHGFEWPLHPQQVAAWVIIVIFLIQYFTMVGPLLRPFAAALTVSCIEVVLGLSTVTLKIAATLAPNEDIEIQQPQLSREEYIRRRFNPPEGKLGCPYCRQYTDKSARHCGVCDKCVAGFDHHCQWLNSCVGARNYKLFFAFVTSTVLSIALLFVSSIVAIGQCGADTTRCEQQLRRMYGAGNSTAYFVIISPFVVFNLVGLVAISYLWAYHIRVIVSGKSTYQRIKSADKKKQAGDGKKRAGCCDAKKRRNFKAEMQKEQAAVPPTSPPSDKPPATADPVPSSASPAAPAESIQPAAATDSDDSTTPVQDTNEPFSG